MGFELMQILRNIGYTFISVSLMAAGDDGDFFSLFSQHMLNNVNYVYLKQWLTYPVLPYCILHQGGSRITHSNYSKDRQLIVPIIWFNCFLVSRYSRVIFCPLQGDSKSVCLLVCVCASVSLGASLMRPSA